MYQVWGDRHTISDVTIILDYLEYYIGYKKHDIYITLIKYAKYKHIGTQKIKTKWILKPTNFWCKNSTLNLDVYENKYCFGLTFYPEFPLKSKNTHIY